MSYSPYKMPTISTTEEDELIFRKIRNAVRKPSYGSNRSATRILPHLYIGNYDNAENIDALDTLRITHVLNMAAYSRFGSPYGPGINIQYKQFFADDCEGYDILQHFTAAKHFVDDARASRGKCLVHCAMGINRSGAICAAYLMVHDDIGAIEACERIKALRGSFLCNTSFQRQLVKFARRTGLIKHDRKYI